MKNRLLKISSFKNQTSGKNFHYCFDTLNHLKITLKKCIAFYANNTKTNFGEVNKK